jgi:Nif-specific regulatory protein
MTNSFHPYFFLDTLKQILDSVDPHSPFQTGLKQLLQIVAQRQAYKRISLAIFDPKTDSLKLSLSHGDTVSSNVQYLPGQGISGQVLETGKPIIVPNPAEHPSFLNKAFGRSKDELSQLSFISVPVALPEERDHQNPEVIGVLSIDIEQLDYDLLSIHCLFLEVLAGIIARQTAHLQEEMAQQEHLKTMGLISGEQPRSLLPQDIVVSSKSMNMVLQQVAQVAPSRATVLLRGESGTGKELVAQAIHNAGPRHNQPFIKLNCAALPSELLESELFGHEKGAFTGAIQTKKGRFELADKGSLFLDEIGELSAEAQAKLLRAVQEGEIQRLGSEKYINVDVRLICATHRPLEKLLEQGFFREDLYYRINVFPVFIPPLRERPADILPLAEYFLQDFAQEYDKNIKRISTPAIDLLVQYHWPGNVRELRNCLERAVLICNEEAIRTYHLPPTLQTAESSATDTNLSFGEAVARFEQELLVESLKKTKGNMLQTARELRASYRIINYKVKKYGLDPKKFSEKN